MSKMIKIEITESQAKTLFKLLDSVLLKANAELKMRTGTGREIKGQQSLSPEMREYYIGLVADLTQLQMRLKKEIKPVFTKL